jgi:hypothetical protein
MWQASLVLTAALIPTAAFAQEANRTYGPFDAIAEGASRNNARGLALIGSQLQTVNQLRLTAGPRTFFRDPSVSAVYAYGRRGIFGLRPRGYVVVRRTPATPYRGSYNFPPLYGASEDPSAYATWNGVRQPIGHQLSQTGPNRWEYRPLYADDDLAFDEMHRQIERELRPPGENESATRAGYAADAARPLSNAATGDVPEELPEPLEQRPDEKAADRATFRGGARDIARQAPEDRGQRFNGQAAAMQRPESRVPPPPQPDPPDQPKNAVTPAHPRSEAAKKPAATNARPAQSHQELRGPILQDPATGAREF